MYRVELYARVRRACMVEGMSTREAARVFGLHRDTVRKMLRYSVPPGYRRQSPPRRPKLDPYRGVIDRILEEDRSLPRKQRHTAKRIYDRLRAEHGFDGRYTIVKDYVRGAPPPDTGDVRPAHTSSRRRPVRLWSGQGGDRWGGADRPLPGHVPPPQRRMLRQGLPRRDDGGVLRRSRLGLPRSWAACPAASSTTNTRLAVARILGDGRRKRTRVFSELVSHYLFEDRYGRPGRGNDKGKVEGLVGYARRNFLVPIPSFESFDALNAYLEGEVPGASGKTAARAPMRR